MTEPNRAIAVITVTHYITEDGGDGISVETDNMAGEGISIIQAIGMLQLAQHELVSYEDSEG